MPGDKNIRNYTAADIAKYWKGELSLSEMHALEKVAMDDPFLADALEGYQHAKDPGTEIKDLRGRLSRRTDRRGGVLPGIFRNTWFRAAAAVIIVAGLGILGSQLFRVNENNELAKSENKEPAPSSVPDTITVKEEDPGTSNLIAPIITPDASQRDQAVTIENDTQKLREDHSLSLSVPLDKIDDKTASAQKNKKADTNISAEVFSSTQPVPQAVTVPANSNQEKQSKFPMTERAPGGRNRGIVANNAEALSNAQVYYGRVVDAQNNPLPFANVMNLKDQVGTYTDIRGNFNLISRDTAMDLQVKSLGYETKKYRVEPSGTPVNLVMKEDLLATNNASRKPIPKLIILSKNRTDTLEEEEEASEPEIGWQYYDTYITNNLKYQKADWTNQLAGIELSFQVDQHGRPTNIKIIKSSKCKECNQEAIRLLKEGPNWIRKGKKKTTVTIGVEK